MTRRLVARALPFALVASLLGLPVRGQPAVPDGLRAFAILPPGQDGSLLTSEIFTGGGPHVDDQLERYAALPDDPEITDAELSAYFHSFGFQPEPPFTQLSSPTSGADIYRDALGIPHIYATGSFDDAAIALGYVTAYDRLFEMDVFRHVARGRGAEFLGPGFLESDVVTRREGYTEAEVQAMIDALPVRFGAVGQKIKDALQKYADGVNIAVGELGADPPVEYAATGNPWPPDAWEPADSGFIGVLQFRALGESAGAELHNAAIYRYLQKRLGKKLGASVFNDLLFQRNKRSQITIPPSEGTFPSQGLGKTKKAAIAIPDDPKGLLAREAADGLSMQRLYEQLGLNTPASFELAVGPGESSTGNPLHVGGPQVGYAVPSFFMDIDVHVPSEGIHFRGPAIPGVSLLVPVGRGPDWAWSLTSGASDAVDVRVERLCDPGGGAATIDSAGTLFTGACEPMTSRPEAFDVKGGATVQHTFFRTRHGPVFARGTLKGDPVALVRDRFFWMKELDSIPSVFQWNTDADTVEEFAAAADAFTMSFNAVYVNAEHIAYYHVGAYPQRTSGVHPALPTWGTGEWEFQGRFPASAQPHVVDPAQGWLANWNNRPSRGWAGMDSFKWGSVQRVQLLQDHLARLTKGAGTVDLAEMAQVIADGATRDLRAYVLGRRMVRWAGRVDEKGLEPALKLVRKWLKRGSHRQNLDRDDLMDAGAALAIFDAWYEALVHRIFDDELGRPFYELELAPPITDFSPTGGGSFWFDFSSYVDDLFHGGKGYALDYCDNGRTTKREESCADQVVAALRVALKKEAKDQGTSNVRKWKTAAENLVFDEFGGLSVPEIPWQNRGTWNHLVEVLNEV